MTEELYWRAQWVIGQLEEGRAIKQLSNDEEDALDVLLAA